MALVDMDRGLLQRCLERDPQSWHEFVDRFLGVFTHVIRHTASMRSVSLDPAEIDDLIGEILKRLVDNDFRVLRHFRGKSSLSTYLVIVARRIVVNQLARRAAILTRRSSQSVEEAAVREVPAELRIDDQEEVEHLLEHLRGREAELVRGFYIDQKSYEELSQEIGIPPNSIGPTLGRILKRIRKAAATEAQSA